MVSLGERLTILWQRLSGGAAPSGNAALGAVGERAAEAHLRANGLRVLARNWRNPDDEREEIDLVCEEPAGPGDASAVLVFVEVKARVTGARVGGYYAVDRRKKAVLLRACRAYLGRLRPQPPHVRFDVVEVVHGADAARSEAMSAMKMDGAVASMREGRQVWHYRNVSLFPPRTLHRHG